MKKLVFLLLLISSLSLKAQITAVSATVTDGDGQTWNNGTWQVSFVPNPNYPNINSYNINGVALNSSTYNSYLGQQGSLSNSGAFSVNLLDNTTIAPTGTSWRFTITPNASVPATVYPSVAVSGATFNLTSFLSSNTVLPRFAAKGYGSYGYLDAEVSTAPLQGAFYWNVTNQVQRVWTGTSWISISYSGVTPYCALTGCTFTGGISGTTANFPAATSSYNLYGITTVNINGIPQADQFIGADPCLKLQAAITYALANSINLVDATHFTNNQTSTSCSVNPFGTLTGYVNLAIYFGSAKFKILQPWAIVASGLTLIGNGPASTQIEYVGSGTSVNIVSFTSTEHNKMDGFFIYGGPSLSSTPATALYLQATHRSEFNRISTWGATSGFYTAGAVTDTFNKIHTSVDDATYLLSDFGSGLPVPVNGWVLNSFGGNLTVDGTVTDAAFEGVSGPGIKILAANQMTFTGGTSELNGSGISIAAGSKWNNFIATDIEQNASGSPVTGEDINDQGQSNFYINVLAHSTCTSPCTHSATFGTGGGQYIFGDSGFNSTWTGSVNIVGVNSNFGSSGSTFTAPVNATLLDAPILNSSGSTAVTLTAGTGITSVTCASTVCTTARGILTIVNSSATTGTLATVNITNPTAPVCTWSQQNTGTGWYGFYSSVSNTSGFNLVPTNSVSGVTSISAAYQCTL